MSATQRPLPSILALGYGGVFVTEDYMKSVRYAPPTTIEITQKGEEYTEEQGEE